MSLEEKFRAAVNVIRSLPKSGSYQPSNELMLRFYSYFKQATEGPCLKDKPGFWDVVNRAKWEAWNKLGDMTKDEAMQAYVNELHKIVETMSFNSDVASFLSVEDDSSSFPSADLQLVAGDVLARCRSSENSPDFSRSVSGSSSPVRSASPATTRTRHDSDDEFIDTEDVTANDQVPLEHQRHSQAPRLSNGHAHQITSQLTHLKVLEQLPGVLNRLEADVAALRKAVEGDRRILDQVSSGWRWPWQELSPPTLLLVIVWPIILYRLTARRQRSV
ncbi:acyl-CoA-binding domain-containing protein 5 isoform X1 [Danaus plexippus]|uniref:acyl-CoA-binding domain-containing protein 5 isoform X1 n=2 Tax=Danaus plexippus TaxID=13037 RepID=UPI002AB0B54F|nr:acyl-CoA-binding domain-containing protein 5 isoform X1 [Danaus plexippus]XP_032525250.2 acyl-CoA-binding domain-containing protein 5 isoform X1 [Danaus plexippus]